MKDQEPVSQTFSRALLDAFRAFLEIVRDYGMSTVAFGAGVYAFLTLLQETLPVELRAGVAVVLVVVGLVSQLWIYSRENPRAYNTDILDHLDRMTALVEKLATSRSVRQRHDGDAPPS